MITPDKEKESQVNIHGGKKQGYIIEVQDEYSKNRLAVTYEELEKIVLYANVMLKDSL